MPTALGCFQKMLGSGGVALVGVHHLISTFKMLSLYFCICCPPYTFVPHGGTRSALVWDTVRSAMYVLGLGQSGTVSSFKTGTMWDPRGIIYSFQVQSSTAIKLAKTSEREGYMSSDLWCSWWPRLCVMGRENNSDLSWGHFCLYHLPRPFFLFIPFSFSHSPPFPSSSVSLPVSTALWRQSFSCPLAHICLPGCCPFPGRLWPLPWGCL